MSQLETTLKPLLEDAKHVFQEILDVEDALRRDYDRLICIGWRLGRSLHQLKAKIGHGKWLFWLGGHMPDIGEDKAQRCMQLFASNEGLSNPANLRDFDTDSIRKFLGGYMPAKIRPQLEGDQKLAPVVTFDSGTNKFAAFFRRISQGHATPPPWETVAPQAKLIVDGLRTIYGDRITELLQ